MGSGKQAKTSGDIPDVECPEQMGGDSACRLRAEQGAGLRSDDLRRRASTVCLHEEIFKKSAIAVAVAH